MKLYRLTAKNFLGITEADLDLSRPVTFVFGDNGSGKSSIAEAVRFALTRTARGTDAAGRGAAQLVKDGANKAEITLAYDNEGIAVEIAGSSVSIAAGGRFSGKAAESYLRGTLGTPELLRCLTDATRVLEMSAKEQSELLSGLLGEGCTLAQLEEKALKILSPEAVATLIEGVGGRLPKGGTVTPAILKDAYDGAYRLRTEYNAALKQLKAAPVEAPLVDAPIPTEDEIQAAREALEQIENEGFDLRTRNGVALEAARAQGRLIEQEKALRTKLEALPKVEAPAQTEMAMGPTIEQLQATLEAAQDFERGAREVAETRAAELKERQREEASLRAQAEGNPLACDGTIGKGAACPLAPKPEPVSPAKLSAAQKRLGDAMTAGRNAKAGLAVAAQATEAARTALTAAREAAARSAGATEAQRTALEEQLQQLAIQIEAAGDTTSIVSQLDEALLANARTKAEAQRLVEAKLYVGQQRAAWETYAAKLKSAEADAALLDEVTKALEPRALPLAILSDSINPFVEQVNAVLVQIAPYRIAIDTEDGLSLRVISTQTGRSRAPVMLSKSELMRVGAALSLALGQASGLGFCVIDAVDILTKDNRAEFVRVVEALGLESVIVLGSYEQPPFGGDEATAVYWVEGGEVNSVDAKEGVLS